jgi:hypothetical protein
VTAIPIRQVSFAAGEISPLAYGRTDHPRYASSLRRMVNFLATAVGAAKNRPGTRWIASTKSNAVARRIPFVFSSDQTYVLEVGNGYIRFLQNGGLVISGTAPYEIASPFTTAMLPYLGWEQVGDVMTICYGGQAGGVAAIAPRELKRLGHTNWTIGAVNTTAQASGLFNVGVDAPVPQPDATHPAKDWRWQVTLLYKDANGNGFESAPLDLVPPAWGGGTTYAQGDPVRYSGIDYTSLQAGNVGHQPDTSPTWWARGIVVWPDTPNKVSGDYSAFALGPSSVTGILLYRGKQGVFGRIASAGPNSHPVLGANHFQCTDDGGAPDFSSQPPQSTDPFGTPSGDYPSVVAFYEQRRVFGGHVFHPQRISGSKPGDYSNFDTTLFTQDDDAIVFDIASAQLDEIRHLISGPTMLALSQSGLWRVRGFQGSPLAPASVDLKRDARVGASRVRPALAGDDVLFVRERGSGVSGAIYDGNFERWRVSPLDVLAKHLFEGHTIVAVAFAQEPDSILWAVRDDGVLLGLTRIGDPAQGGVLAWHQHTTDGFVEDVCVVPEGTEDAVYLGVRRTINGATVRYHERMATRLVTDVRTAVFLDASLQFDGRSSDGSTMTFLSDSTYAGGEEGTITASAAKFFTGGADDVGDEIVLDTEGTAGGPFRLTILSVTDATHVRARLDTPNLPAAFQNVATPLWAFARDTMTSLDHLEGKSVTVLAEGKVQGPFTVAGGAIALAQPAYLAQIGLGYQSLLELLDVGTGGAELRNKQKTVHAITVEVHSSRGCWAGEDETNLFEADDQRTVADGFGPAPLLTGRLKIRIRDSASPDGRAVVVQKDPLPLCVTSITRHVSAGGDL